MTGRDPIELGREGPAPPGVLVEAAAEDPRAVRQAARVRPDAVERVLQRRRVGDIEPRHLLRPPDEVHVRVEPAGHHDAAAQVDDLRSSRLAANVVAASDRGNPTIAREERLATGAVADVDPTTVEEDRAHPRKPAWPRSGTNFTGPWRSSRPRASRTTSSCRSRSPIGATMRPSALSCITSAGSIRGVAAVVRMRSL